MLKAVRTMLIVLLNILLIGIVGFGGVELCHVGYRLAYRTVGDTSRDLPPGREVTFYIAENETEYEVAKDLARKDLIADRFSFYLRMRLEKSDDVSLQSGSYTLNSSMTYDDIRHAIYRKKTDTLK